MTGSSDATRTDRAVRVAPIVARERVESIDVVRGLAILGILPVNLIAFKASFGAMIATLSDAAPVDTVFRWITFALFQQKFYTLFAFLFGLGFAIQEERTADRGGDPKGLWRRRLVSLAGIGAFHAFAIWWGDILLTYAILGWVLFAFRGRRPRTCLWWAVGLGSFPWLLQIGVSVAIGSLATVFPEVRDAVTAAIEPMREGFVELQRRSVAVYGSGSIAQIFAQRARDVATLYGSSFPVFPYIAALMIAGYGAGRAGVHRRLREMRPTLRRALPWLFGIGLAGNAAYATWMTFEDPLTPSLGLAGAVTAAWIAIPALSAAYAASCILAWHSDAARRALAPLAAVGRTALSAYLAQSIVATTVLYSYGLGLYGRVGLARGWILVAVLWVVLPVAATWWLARFRFGPAEWLWRSLVYLRAQPMRPARDDRDITGA